MENKKLYLGMDVETGGIGADKSLLSAYFELVDENLNTIDSLMLLTKPNDGIYKVTAEALNINKINLIEHDKVALTEGQAGTKLYEFLEKNNPDGTNKFIPVGHNVAFDISFLQAHIISVASWNKYVSYRKLDTGGVAQFLKFIGEIEDSNRGSLGNLAEHYGISTQGAHTADADVRMCLDLLAKWKFIYGDKKK